MGEQKRQPSVLGGDRARVHCVNVMLPRLLHNCLSVFLNMADQEETSITGIYILNTGITGIIIIIIVN